MGAAASAAQETAGEGSGGEEQECRICRHPAEPERPLRHPCACRGTIRFVHDDCQLRCLAATRQRRCEVCGHEISIHPIYGADAPALAKLASLILLPLCLVLTVKIVWKLTSLSLWRLALAGTRRPLSARALGRKRAPRKIWRTPGPLPGPRAARPSVFLLVGRIILLCIGEVDSFTSTPPILLIGYGFIFSLGATFTGLLHNTGGVLPRFARGFHALSDLVEQFWDFCVLDLYDYVVDERIVIGQRLEDVADGR